ncbi:MAG TPA: hypothetical protein VJR22_06920 [Candidatus Nitrosotalea sp.]|nr:hypothetical protein [Candidatus Nitrosotalea sp.]
MMTIIPYCAIVAMANMAVFSVLIATFVKMYSKTKSQVHLGMIFFVGMLFLDNAVNVYTYFFMFNLYQEALLPFILAVRIIQLVGSLVFLKITWQ